MVLRAPLCLRRTHAVPDARKVSTTVIEIGDAQSVLWLKHVGATRNNGQLLSSFCFRAAAPVIDSLAHQRPLVGTLFYLVDSGALGQCYGPSSITTQLHDLFIVIFHLHTPPASRMSPITSGVLPTLCTRALHAAARDRSRSTS